MEAMETEPRRPILRLPRTIRFDASDERVFERAAAPGEWAVSGAFAFADADPATLDGKARQAFRSGFLGTASFGWSTFVAVAEITPEDFGRVTEALAAHFCAAYGAPSLQAAREVAHREVRFAADLCAHPINTLLAVQREFGPAGIVERFRTIERKSSGGHARIWAIELDKDDG